jgi:integral membrane protein
MGGTTTLIRKKALLLQKLSLSVLKYCGYAEGTSFLLLLGIAMPIKYWTGLYNPVPITGMLHGVLFVIFIAAVIFAAILNRWSIMRILGAFVSAFIPFGPFILESRIRKSGTS